MPPSTKKKLYVACAINNVPPELKVAFLASIGVLKVRLRERFDVLDFLGTAEGDPRQTYHWDIIECVMKSDCVLAICDYASTGMGIEIGAALWGRKVPVLALAHVDSSVSRLVQGVYGLPYEYGTYESLSEVPERAFQTLTRMMQTPRKQRCPGLCPA